MFSKRTIERLAGALLVAGFVAFLGHGLTLSTVGIGHTTILLVLMYGFLIILSATPLYLTFRSHERTLALFGAFGLAAHGLFVVLVCALILAQFSFEREFAATSGAEADAVAAVGRALELTMDKIRTSAFLFLALGLAPLGVLIACSGAVARWVGWLGAVAGILGFLGVFAFYVGGPASMLYVIFLMFGFIFILGVRLLARATRQATAGKLQTGETLSHVLQPRANP